jgi:glycosyltransferase involved in cell wall biosynthesis
MITKQSGDRIRLAIVVSHPIQYYVPLYRRLASRNDLEVKVFFTWHGGERPQHDPGFEREVAWDIPLTEGYEYEVVANVSRRPGSDHFWGLRNPHLVSRVLHWKPDAVHITGYAYASHLYAMWFLHRYGVPVFFRGDSHLLDRNRGLRWRLKQLVLHRIYKWPTACLYVGKHNYDYFRKAGVPDSRLFYCPHSIEVERFSEPNEELEERARLWRNELEIPPQTTVLLFAGKFARKKRPLELMNALARMQDRQLVLVMVGNGELEDDIRRIATQSPGKFRILPFQNQSVMPVVYRLGDIFVLPSAYGETWGLAVNEALASGRKVLVSDRVGCAPDLIKSANGTSKVFRVDDWDDFECKLRSLVSLNADAAEMRRRAKDFDIAVTESSLMVALEKSVASSVESDRQKPA